MSDPLMKTAKELQAVARHFADRQNSDSTLTARECHAVVNACLNGGNLLEQEARNKAAREAAPSQENTPCPTSAANPTSTTPPSSPTPAAN